MPTKPPWCKGHRDDSSGVTYHSRHSLGFPCEDPGHVWCAKHGWLERVGYGHAVADYDRTRETVGPPSTSAAHALPVQALGARVESVIEQGYEASGHLSAIRDIATGHFMARMLLTWEAEAAVWAINHVANGMTLAAVESRFQTYTIPNRPNAGPHFYEGPTSEAR